MYLLIDPSEKNKIKIIGFDETKIETEVFDAPNRDILVSVDSFLQSRKMKQTDVQGIAVVVGVGGFTSTRIATTLANAWHFAFHIPVVAVNLEEASEPQKLIEKFTSANAGTASGNYILAEYSGEPNVGKI